MHLRYDKLIGSPNINIFFISQMCKMFKRPFAKRARDTGAWLLAFQILAIMSIMTNCGILYLSPQVKYVIVYFFM